MDLYSISDSWTLEATPPLSSTPHIISHLERENQDKDNLGNITLLGQPFPSIVEKKVAPAAEIPMAWQESPEGLSADWVFSNNSNVHTCNDRKWFTEFTPFETFVATGYGSATTAVEGVGTVDLPVKRNPNRSGPQAHHIIRLTNVLYTPLSDFNIVGAPLLEVAARWNTYGTTKCKGTMADLDGHPIAFFSPTAPLLCLKLSGPPIGPRLAPTKFKPNVAYLLTVLWPDSERARWDARDQQDDSEASSPQWDGEQPYTTEEKAWLNKHYQGEYKFLASYGLSIYDDEERAEGRAIMRAMARQRT